MSLSIESGYPAQLSPVQQMDRLVSFVVNRVRYPLALATRIPEFRSLRNLEFYNTCMMGNAFISALKNVNTLEKLTIHSEISADMAASMVTTINEQGQETSHDCTQQGNGPRKLAYVSLMKCKFLEDPVLEAVGNIKTLSSISIGYAPAITSKGINAFCEQLNLLPELSSITLSGPHCVDDSTLSILGSSSTSTISKSWDVTKTITLKLLDNVTKEALDQLSKKQGVSLISYNCARRP